MTDTLLDILNRRQLSTQQFATYLLKEYGLPSLNDAYKAARIILLDAEDITSVSKRNKVLAKLKRDVTPIISDAMDNITTELNALSIAEAAFITNTLKEFSPVDVKRPVQATVKKYAEAGIMSLESASSSTAGTWSDFVKRYTDDVYGFVRSAVLTGARNGETVQQISKRVKLSTDGIAKNRVDTLVRTGVQHFAQQANLAMRDDNLDVIGREVPITTWDSRRSLICTSIESKYGVNGSISKGWPAGKSPIGYNPYHYGCRTIIRFLPDGVDLEGARPAIAGKDGEAAKEAFERKQKLADKRLDRGGSGVVGYTGRKDKAFEPELIKVDTQLSKFIRDQPRWYQQQLLGKARAEAFRAGDLDLSKLTDKNLRPRTLEQLDL